MNERDEALRLAKEAGFTANRDDGDTWNFFGSEQNAIRLIALARATAAPQEPEPDPSDELAWYKWAHKELGRRNTKLAEENFQYWQKERDAAPQPQAPSSDDVRDFAGLAACATCGQDMTGSDAAEITRLQAALADARDKAQTADARDAQILKLLGEMEGRAKVQWENQEHASGQMYAIRELRAAIRAMRTNSESAKPVVQEPLYAIFDGPPIA